MDICTVLFCIMRLKDGVLNVMHSDLIVKSIRLPYKFCENRKYVVGAILYRLFKIILYILLNSESHIAKRAHLHM